MKVERIDPPPMLKQYMVTMDEEEVSQLLDDLRLLKSLPCGLLTEILLRAEAERRFPNGVVPPRVLEN